MKILITGAAGFIGFHLSKKLIEKKYSIIGVDNINKYYDVLLKKKRIKELKKNKNFYFYKIDLKNKKKIYDIVKDYKIKYIVHLAAQAGVRNSIKNPEAYFNNNLQGFFNILEASRINKIEHLIFASTSSVYGDYSKFPLKENFNTDKPLSFYAATKKSNEVMAYSYANTYKISCTALRFFTVYGPYGRPDMALYRFTEAIVKNKTFPLYNSGNHERDFTYIDDVIKGIMVLIKKPSTKKIPFNCFNIGSGKTNSLKVFLNIIEKNLGKKSKINKLPLQLADVKKTHSSVNLLKKYSSYNPKTDIEIGIKEFIKWYKIFNKKK